MSRLDQVAQVVEYQAKEVNAAFDALARCTTLVEKQNARLERQAAELSHLRETLSRLEAKTPGPAPATKPGHTYTLHAPRLISENTQQQGSNRDVTPITERNVANTDGTASDIENPAPPADGATIPKVAADAPVRTWANIASQHCPPMSEASEARGLKVREIKPISVTFQVYSTESFEVLLDETAT